MLTNAIVRPADSLGTPSTSGKPRVREASDARTVVIVNGTSTLSELLEAAVDGGHYDVVFVEAVAHAYSQVKKVKPDLVIISIKMDDVDGLRVLSMLKLDPDTRRIPVLTHTSADEDDASAEESASEDHDEMFVRPIALRMN